MKVSNLYRTFNDIQMKILETSIKINATPLRVWEVLTAFHEYSIWNPFILKLEGSPVLSSELKVTLLLEKKKPMIFKPKVVSVSEAKAFSWIGRFLIPGIFDGHHQFRLEDNGDGSTTLIHKEEFKGLLVPFLKKMIEVDTKNAFEKMNLALKHRCEE